MNIKNFNRTSARFFSTIIILLLTISVGFAQEKMHLSDCLKLAFKNSKLIKISDLSYTIAREKLAESKSQRLPSVNLSSMYTRIGKITSFTIPMGSAGLQKFQFGTPNRVNVDIKLQIPVFTWGRIRNTISLSEVGRKLSQVQRDQQIKSVTDQVLRAYYAVLLNQEVIRLHKMNVKRSKSHWQVTEERFVSGLVPRLETLRARVQVKNAETALREAEGNLVKSKIFLAKVIGIENQNFSLADSFTYTPITLDENELIARALSVRSNLRIMRLQQQMSQNQIAIAKSGNKPNIFLFSGYNVMNGFDPLNPDKFVDNYNVGVQLAVPLFDGFASAHKVQQAKLAYQSAQIQEEEIRDMIRMQVQQNIITIEQTKHKIIAQRENIALAKEALAVAKKQYNSGLVSSLDVLDAQQALSQGELIYTQAIFNHIMAKLDLCQAIEDYSWFESAVTK